MLNENIEVFVIHVSSSSLKSIHPNRKAQITSLITEKVIILDEYLDFANIFSEQQALVLLKQTKLNQHAIKLQNGKQLSYRLIYSLWLVELKILKIYIKINLLDRFIWPSKSPADASIFFI